MPSKYPFNATGGELIIVRAGYAALHDICMRMGGTAAQYLADALKAETYGTDRVSRDRAKGWLCHEFTRGLNLTPVQSLYGMRPAAQAMRIVAAHWSTDPQFAAPRYAMQQAERDIDRAGETFIDVRNRDINAATGRVA